MLLPEFNWPSAAKLLISSAYLCCIIALFAESGETPEAINPRSLLV